MIQKAAARLAPLFALVIASCTAPVDEKAAPKKTAPREAAPKKALVKKLSPKRAETATVGVKKPTDEKVVVEKPADDGFKPMFNGKDLTGWKTTGNWTVMDENTVTLKPRPGEHGWQRYAAYLTTDRKYANFVLDLEFKFEAGGNSGVFMRVGDLKNHVSSGFEVQILDTHAKKKVGNHDCGGVIGTAGPSKNMVKPAGEWNRYVITLVGNSLKVELNGEPIIALDLSKTGLRNRPATGYISFQDEAKPIWYRNVRIKELE